MLENLLLTARYSSTRLPGKMLLQLGNHSILGHSILRAKSAGFNPILCTSTDPSDDLLVSEASKYNIQAFRGDLLNKIQRWSDCLNSSGFNDAHIVDGDDPYFDTQEMMSSLENLRINDLGLVRTSERSDSGFATVGMSATSAFLAELSKRASHLSGSNFDVIPWNLLLYTSDNVSTSPDLYLTKNRATHIRLTIDYPEDLLLMKMVASKFSFDAPRKDIEEYLVQNLDISLVNSSRTEDFLANKKVQLEHNFEIRG